MPLHLANRIKETSISSGSGIIVLGGAPATYQPFSSVLSDGDITYYTVVDNSNWEVGIGTYSSNTLTRDIILSSSNSNNKINLDGSSNVFIAYPSEKSVYKDEADRVVAGSSGILINGGIPGNVSGVLYNANSILYFNGYPLSVSGHLHSASDITNFASGVSGLLPVVSITGGYGVGVTNTSGNHTIYSTLTTVSESYSLVTTVFNRNGSVLPKFSVVYISGGQGDLPTVTLALANGEPKSSKTFGITKEEIPAMSSGHVVVYGNIYGIDTDQFNINAPHGDVNGRILYLSPTVSGGLTIDKPYVPNHLVSVGTVIRTHQNEGVFNVRIQNGFELEELHNVATTGAVSGQFLKYNGGLWRNTGILSSDISDFSSAVSGISPNITITGVSGVGVNKSGNSYTIYTTGTFGLSQSQVLNLLNSGINIYVIDGTGNFSSLSVNGTGVSLSGHTHTSSQITDFNTSVNSLISVKNVSGSGYVNVTATTGNYIVSVSGLQPSGNYSLVGHNHTASNITDFNTATSGLLTPYALLNSGNFNSLFVTGVPVSLSGHTHSSSQITDFNSAVSGLLPFTGVVGSGNVIISSSNRVLNISTSGLQPSGNYSVSGHSHTVSDISNFDSGVSGLLPVKDILPGTNVTITSNNGIYTINSSGGGSGGGSVSVSDPGSGRLLTSDGTSSGIIGQSDLTFIDNRLTVNGVIINNGNNLYMWSNFR